ncbi:MAG: RluA family pseudouridine synthase [Puniceicoccales bacterium]|jgi:23S rRNA pseudouridine1911/1915/1917 synthase|nr:RluA family pseudouridine synthase [Puniceicoccales bacterium]
MPTEHVQLAEEHAGLRLDVALATCFPSKSRSQIRKAIDGGLVLLDGKIVKAGAGVRAGQVVQISWQEIQAPRARPGELSIIYEDGELVAIDKPAGVVVHPTFRGEPSLVDVLLHHTNGQLANGQDLLRPGVVHRLDRDTTGVLLFAKSGEALIALQKQFQRRCVEKLYHAVVAGHLNRSHGIINYPIGRDLHRRTRMAIRPDGRPARSDWEVLLHCAESWSHLAVRIHSGRTHQIRVHLAAIGHPILGDRTYGDRQSNSLPSIPRMLLHAAELRCRHPMTGQPLTLRAPIPEDLLAFVASGQIRQEPVALAAEKKCNGNGDLADGFDGKE